jgi:hypothetical protein
VPDVARAPLGAAVQPAAGDQARPDAGADLDVDHVALALREAGPQLASAMRLTSLSTRTGTPNASASRSRTG